jgi:putative nucleotidyltransferase with HDIG domain
MNRKTLLVDPQFSPPALPSAAVRMIQLLQQPQVEPDRISRALESDSEWARDVLRFAASSVWRRAGSEADPASAVGRMDPRRLLQLVVAAAVAPALRRPLPGYGFGRGDLWTHSLSVAIATREILLEKGLRPSEEAFLVALLHDIGKVTLADTLDAGAQPMEDATAEEAERGASGTDHAEAGALLLEQWRMPLWLVTAVRFHHAPLGSSFVIPDLVHLADALCHAAGIGAGQGSAGFRHRLCPSLSQRWNLSRRSLERIVSRTVDGLEEAEDLVTERERR